MTETEQAIQLLRRAAGISREEATRLNKLYSDLWKEIDVTESLAVNKARINKLYSEYDMKDYYIESLIAVGTAVVAASSLKPVRVSKKSVNEALNIVMPNSKVSTIDLINRTKNLSRTQAINSVYLAINDDLTQKELKQLLSTSNKAMKKHIAMIARTGVNAVTNHTKLQQINNDPNIDRVLFSAVFDSNTSDICKELGGKVFKKEDAPILPLHPNERSQLVPIEKDGDVEVIINQIMPSGGDYEKWLRKQPKSYQQTVIGIANTDKFRDGVSLKVVIDVSPITQKQLEKAIN